jgi:hypothetical protein
MQRLIKTVMHLAKIAVVFTSRYRSGIKKILICSLSVLVMTNLKDNTKLLNLWIFSSGLAIYRWEETEVCALFFLHSSLFITMHTA